MKLLIISAVIYTNSIFLVLSSVFNDSNLDCIFFNSTCEIKLLQNEYEKEDLWNICMNSTKFLTSASYLVSSNSTIFSIKAAKLCPFKTNAQIFGWIPFEKYKEHSFKLEFKEYQLITRSKDEMNKTGNYIYGLFVKEEERPEHIPSTNVFSREMLVEIIPTSYKLDNVCYRLWKNTISQFKGPMRSIVLKNYKFQHTTEHREYSFYQTFKLNLTDILESDYNISGKLEYDNYFINVNTTGEGQIVRNKSFKLSYNIPPRSAVNVTLISDWVVNEYLFKSNILFKYYDLDLLPAERNNKSILITKMINLHFIYDKPVSLDDDFDLIEKSNLSQLPEKANYQQRIIERPILPEKPTETTIEAEIETNPNHTVNAGFEPYFIAGCIIVGVAITLACGGVTKSIIKDRKKAQYQEVPLRRI